MLLKGCLPVTEVLPNNSETLLLKGCLLTDVLRKNSETNIVVIQCVISIKDLLIRRLVRVFHCCSVCEMIKGVSYVGKL